MPTARPKPRYIVVEYTGGMEYDTVAGAVADAQKAHEHDPSRHFAVVELIAAVTSERKPVVNRFK